MKLEFIPTKLAGGVVIKGDKHTLNKIVRLLEDTEYNSHICFSGGACSTLAKYFFKNNETVDWVTLIAGIAILRNSLGYCLSRESHALICLLEHLSFNALCKTLDNEASEIERVLELISGLSDYSGNSSFGFDGLIEHRMVYLYLLKTPERRKAELLKILSSLSIIDKVVNPEYGRQFKQYKRELLCYSCDEPFQYEL